MKTTIIYFLILIILSFVFLFAIINLSFTQSVTYSLVMGILSTSLTFIFSKYFKKDKK